CATTFGSSERSGRTIGSATACHTNATESFFSIGWGVLASTATSHVTNEPDTTPVFTNWTLTGYTPGRLILSNGRASEPVRPNTMETSPRASGCSVAT